MKKKDIRGNYNVKVKKGMLPYWFFFKKIGDRVYRFSKVGNEEWRQDQMPFDEEPYVYWSGPDYESF